MSKIICDVCGTSYPETATQCPICGCVRPADVATVAGDTNDVETKTTGTYTYVKGGRFSKSNVRKRNLAAQASVSVSEDVIEETEQEGGKSEKGLIIAVCALLLAIIAVVIYIAMHFFAPAADKNVVSTTGSTFAATTEVTQVVTTEATVYEIPCVEVVAAKSLIELDKEGAAYLLNVTADPMDTTDEIIFASGDETVATVTPDGKIVAVGPGETEITITCGSAVTQCRVVCNIEVEETTVATEAVEVSDEELKLNRDDFTLTKKGDTWKLYTGKIPVKQITWSSDNEKVVTIADGVVTAVGTGNTKVHAEYNGKKVSCTVRCAPSVGDYVAEVPAETTQNGGIYNISKTDVTISVGESFVLQLLDADNKSVDVIWTVDKTDICSSSGNTIKGLAAGTAIVSVTYEGAQYTCTVRVK